MTGPLPSRAIGRLITVRGSSVVLGFMPLKRFHLDTALDASAVVALRASRLTGETGLTDSTTVGEWLHRLAVDVLAPIVPLLSPRRPLPVVEVGTGVGPLFERLKGLLTGDALGPYTAVGPADEAIRFAMLHDGDGTAHAYAEAFDPAAAGDAALVLNPNQAIRHGHGLDLDWLALAAARRDAARTRGRYRKPRSANWKGIATATAPPPKPSRQKADAKDCIFAAACVAAESWQASIQGVASKPKP